MRKILRVPGEGSFVAMPTPTLDNLIQSRPPRLGRRIGRAIALATLFASLTLIGCNSAKSGNLNAAAPTTNRTDQPRSPRTATPAGARLKSAVSPINYLVGPGGSLTFFDVTDDRIVATAAAPTQALVLIDDEKGIVVANTLVKKGPLPRGHRYEIWLQN